MLGYHGILNNRLKPNMKRKHTGSALSISSDLEYIIRNLKGAPDIRNILLYNNLALAIKKCLKKVQS